MGLKKSGIKKLKEDLMANARHYNQQKFAVTTPECGTEVCMAGMCLLNTIGRNAFTKRFKRVVASGTVKARNRFENACVEAGAEQAGITLCRSEDGYYLRNPPIFETVWHWPTDLRTEYEAAAERHDHVAMATVACKALDRIDSTGHFKKITELQYDPVF